MAPTYHIQLRRFPKASTRFNLTGQQVGAIVIPWVQERVLEVDGEKWAPYDATITIIEGPPIPIDRLSLGRGWTNAAREGEDVTARVLDEARSAVGRGGEKPAPAQQPPAGETARDYPSAAAEAGPATPSDESGLGALLGPEGGRLLVAWRGVAARTGGLAPSESLALAERELQRDDPSA